MKKDKTKLNLIYSIVNVFIFPLISAIMGFGLFWLYRLQGINVWISILVGMYVSAMMNQLLIHIQK